MRSPDVRDGEEQEFGVFVRRARQAVHQALFFLYELEEVAGLPDDDPLKGEDATEFDVQFAREQVKVILDAVRLPKGDLEGWLEPAVMRRGLDAFFFLRDGQPQHLFAMHRKLRAAEQGERQHARNTMMSFWRDQVVGLVDRSGWRETTAISQLRAFLRLTRPEGFDAVGHHVERGWTMFRRNLTFIVGLLGAVVAFSCVEQLRSLLTNNGVGFLALGAVAFGGLFIEVLRYSPLLGLQALGNIPGKVGDIAKQLAKRGALKVLTLKLRMGKRAFYQWAAHAVPPERGIERWPEAGMMRSHVGRWELIRAALLLIYFVVSSYVIGRGYVAEQSRATFDTVFPIAALFALALIPLHWVDLWSFMDRRPIRLLGMALLILFLVGTLLLEQHLLFAIVIPGALFAVLVFYAVKRRGMNAQGVFMSLACLAVIVSALWGKATTEEEVWRATSSDGQPLVRIDTSTFPFGGAEGPPVVVIAASGGGSRAAVYTSLTLDALHNEGRLVDREGRPQKATEHTPAIEKISKNIHAISSVSGGSLATAAYIAERIRRNEHAAAGTADSGVWDVTDFTRKNFLLPTLAGALMPGRSRGKAIEDFWEQEGGFRGRTIRDLTQRWDEATKGKPPFPLPPFPLPLFNTCALDGHAVVISPLKREAYSKDSALERRARWDSIRSTYGLSGLDGLTWVLDRDAIFGLDEWNDRVNPTLVQAVRASANFPFGFPLVDVETPIDYGEPLQHGVNRILLTDGGVLSNSGVWSLFHLMTANDGVRAALKKRGVLMIVIDAGKMPEYRARQTGVGSLFGAIRDQAPIAQSLHRKMFDLLQLKFGDRVEIVGVDLPPTILDNIQTTWALDDRSLKRLECTFEALWTGNTFSKDERCRAMRGAVPSERGHVVDAFIRKRLAEAWTRLETPGAASGGAQVAQRVHPAMLRIPLD